MAVNETIAAGKKYRRCIDPETKQWERLSFWSKASDTECEDGMTVESKIGNIKGITTQTDITETGYAADATTVSQCFQSVSEGKRLVASPSLT